MPRVIQSVSHHHASSYVSVENIPFLTKPEQKGGKRHIEERSLMPTDLGAVVSSADGTICWQVHLLELLIAGPQLLNNKRVLVFLTLTKKMDQIECTGGAVVSRGSVLIHSKIEVCTSAEEV